MISITSNAAATEAYFKVLRDSVPARVQAVTYSGAVSFQKAVKSIVPVKTGAYKASIRVETVSSGKTHFEFEIGSDLPYGMTLEFGDHGVDSRGKVRNYPPRPHFRPVAAEFEPHFIAEISGVLT